MKKTGKLARIVIVVVLVVLGSSAGLAMPSVRARVYRALVYSGSESLRNWSLARLEKLGGAGAEALSSIALDEEGPEDLRLRLVEHLTRLKAEAAPAVPALAALLADERPRLKLQAVEALQAIGPQAAPATPALILALDSENRRLRDLTAEALGAIGPGASAALPVLIERVRKEEEEHVRGSISAAIDRIDPAGKLPENERVAELERRPEHLRLYTCFAHEKSLFLPQDFTCAVPTLIELLRHERAVVRMYAVWALGLTEHCRDDAFAGVCAALKDPDKAVRFEALRAFEELSPLDEEPWPPAIVAMATSDSDAALRAGALRIFGRRPRITRGVAAVVRAAMQDPAPEVRVQALLTLESAELAEAQDLPALLAALKDPDPRVQKRALATLGAFEELEEQAAELVEALSSMALHPEFQGVLDKVGSAATAPLVTVLENGSPGARVKAGHALAMLGPEAYDAVPSLSRALEDPSAKIRGAAVTALGAIGPSSGPALPRILSLLDDDSEAVRGAVIAALKGIGLATPEVIAALGLFLGHEDPAMRRRALDSLAGLNPRDHVTAPLIRPLLRDPVQDIRRGAIIALGPRGAEAAVAVPELIVILNQDQPELRWRAADTLASIGAGAEAAIPALDRAVAQSSNKDLKRSAAEAARIIRAAARASPPG